MIQQTIVRHCSNHKRSGKGGYHVEELRLSSGDYVKVADTTHVAQSDSGVMKDAWTTGGVRQSGASDHSRESNLPQRQRANMARWKYEKHLTGLLHEVPLCPCDPVTTPRPKVCRTWQQFWLLCVPCLGINSSRKPTLSAKCMHRCNIHHWLLVPIEACSVHRIVHNRRKQHLPMRLYPISLWNDENVGSCQVRCVWWGLLHRPG